MSESCGIGYGNKGHGKNAQVCLFYNQRWSTFLQNHARAIVACDFFVAVTSTFRVLYVFVAIITSGQSEWADRVIAMLKERGVHFPVPRPGFRAL